MRKPRLSYITSGLVLAEMPGKRHELALRALTMHLEEQRIHLGLRKRLPGLGAYTCTVGGSELEADDSFFADGFNNGPTVIIEIAASQTLGEVKIKAAAWCQSPGIRAVLMVKIDARTQTMTFIKVVPVFRDIGTRSGLFLYQQEVARAVVRPIKGTPGAYELDPSFDQAVAFTFSDLTNQVPPTGQPNFLFDSDFLLEVTAEVFSA